MEGLFRYFWVKMTLLVPACFLTFSTTQIAVLHGVIYIMAIDTILGIWVSIKFRTFSSKSMARVFDKIGTYFLALVSMWILVAVAPEFTGAMRVVGIFIIITEILSNFEKLALLGFKIPGIFLAKLSKDYYRLFFADKKEYVATEIIDKRDKQR